MGVSLEKNKPLPSPLPPVTVLITVVTGDWFRCPLLAIAMPSMVSPTQRTHDASGQSTQNNEQTDQFDPTYKNTQEKLLSGLKYHPDHNETRWVGVDGVWRQNRISL